MTTITAASKVTARQRQQAGRIQKRRTKLGLNRAELARQAGVSPAMIANLEGGIIPANSRKLVGILEQLDKLEQKNGKAKK